MTHESDTIGQVRWWLMLPLRVVITIAVVAFDMALSRYLVAFAIVSAVYLPVRLFVEVSTAYWFWPTLVLGALLVGLWDCCDIFGIRSFVPEWLLLGSSNDVTAERNRCSNSR